MRRTNTPADNGVHFERAKEEKKRVLSGRVPTYACMCACAPSQHNQVGDDEGRDEAERSLSLEYSLVIFPFISFPLRSDALFHFSQPPFMMFYDRLVPDSSGCMQTSLRRAADG